MIKFKTHLHCHPTPTFSLRNITAVEFKKLVVRFLEGSSSITIDNFSWHSFACGGLRYFTKKNESVLCRLGRNTLANNNGSG